MNNNSKIAIFDSGFGGISVLKKVIEKIPNDNYIYFADAKHAPYGRRSPEEVLNLCKKAFNILFEKDIKALIIACNTSATLFEKEKCTENYKSKIIFSIHPEIQEAIEDPNTKNILLMATAITCKSLFVHNTISNYLDKEEKFDYDCTKYITKNGKTIYILPSHEIVPYVENNKIDTQEFSNFLTELLVPYANIDSIILGCTHFPFVKNQIEQVYHTFNKTQKIQFFDNAISLSELIFKTLSNKGLLNHESSHNKKEKHTIEILDTSRNISRLEMYKSLTNNTNFEYIMI